MTMNIITLTPNEQPVSSGFRVDVSRGERIGRVSSEWFSRPDDERYLSLTDLYDAVRRRAENAQARTVESRAVRVEASRDNAERLALIVPGRDAPVAPTHWSFGQLCSLVGAPSGYLRQLPAPWPGSICNTACSPTAPNWSRPWKPMTAGRASRRHRSRLWPHLGPRAGRRRA
jgi:hypothetical protein